MCAYLKLHCMKTLIQVPFMKKIFELTQKI